MAVGLRLCSTENLPATAECANRFPIRARPTQIQIFLFVLQNAINLEGYDNSSILVVSKNICERLRYILRLKSNYWHMAPVFERKLRSSLEFPFFVRAAVGVYCGTIKKFLRIEHDIYLMRWSKMEKDRSVLEVDHSCSKQSRRIGQIW